MKAEIHPNYHAVKVHCACGEEFETKSTHKGDIHLEICSACHPFFTGKQKLVDTAGRVSVSGNGTHATKRTKAQRGEGFWRRARFGRALCILSPRAGRRFTDAGR